MQGAEHVRGLVCCVVPINPPPVLLNTTCYWQLVDPLINHFIILQIITWQFVFWDMKLARVYKKKWRVIERRIKKESMYCEDSGQFVIFRLRNPKIRTTQEWVGCINLLRIAKPSFFCACIFFFTRQWKRWKWKQVQTSASNKNQTALEQDTTFLFPWGKKHKSLLINNMRMKMSQH